MNQEVLTIGRLKARYHMPRSAVSERERLDQILRDALGGVLEAALESAGVPIHEEICIRDLSALVRVDLRNTDSAIAVAWSRALAAAIKDALATRSGGIVRYHSRHAALTDVVASSARGDLGRVWAWRRIGLWSGPEHCSVRDAVRLAARALSGEPRAVVPVLQAAEKRGDLVRFLALVEARELERLALSALGAFGLGARAEDALVRRAERRSPDRESGEREAGVRRSMDGRIARAAVAARTSAEGLRALAILALLEVDAAELLGGEASIFAAIDRGEALLAAHWKSADDLRFRRGEPIEAAIAERAGSGGLDDHNASARARSGAERADTEPPAEPLREPARSSAPQGEAAGSSASLVIVGPSGDAPEAQAALSRPGPKISLSDGTDGTPLGGEPVLTAREPDALPPTDERAAATTRAGGLLFLLHLVDPEEAKRAVPGRPLRWILHLVALALLPLEPADPAALAFSGLGPDDDPPRNVEPEPSDSELEGVARIADAIVVRLRARLEDDASSREKLLFFVCRRPAEVIAFAGWIELVFSLDEVSTEIRRAGLDLDPDWLPWLQVVVRFRYA